MNNVTIAPRRKTERYQKGWIMLWVVTASIAFCYIVMVNMNATAGILLDSLSAQTLSLERENVEREQEVAREQSLSAITLRLVINPQFVAVDHVTYLNQADTVVARAR